MKIITTDDGSHSIELDGSTDTYHSRRGAITESEHVFIRSGLEYIADKISIIRVLEIGFGTGLNALLTFEAAIRLGVHVTYTAIDPIPVQEEFWKTLNYCNQPRYAHLQHVFNIMHEAKWNEKIAVSDNFALNKILSPLQDLDLQEQFNLVYFDAFSPRSQPELWTENIFKHLHAALLPGAILVTYSSKGIVRRALQAAGFRVEKIPGPPGKMEIVRACSTT